MMWAIVLSILVNKVSEVDDLKISMIEATFADLKLEGKSYGVVSGILRERGLVILI